MATKYCTYHNVEHILEAFPQQNGKPHGSKCRQFKIDNDAKKSKVKQEQKAFEIVNQMAISDDKKTILIHFGENLMKRKV